MSCVLVVVLLSETLEAEKVKIRRVYWAMLNTLQSAEELQLTGRPDSVDDIW